MEADMSENVFRFVQLVPVDGHRWITSYETGDPEGQPRSYIATNADDATPRFSRQASSQLRKRRADARRCARLRERLWLARR